jgi:hypothetical protein
MYTANLCLLRMELVIAKGYCAKVDQLLLTSSKKPETQIGE